MTDDNVVLVSLGYGTQIVLPAAVLPFLVQARTLDYAWESNPSRRVEFIDTKPIQFTIQPASSLPTLTRDEYEAQVAAAKNPPPPAPMAVIEHAPPPVVEPVRDFVNDWRDPAQELSA
ncbi:MAG: hypothetical protein ACK5XA_08485 [Tagaea sp.]